MDENQMTLATNWHGSNVMGWFVSEKLSGCRAYWDGKKLWTRRGKIIQIPKLWKAKLPTDIHLDGEIFAGRKNFEAAYAATEHGAFTPDIQFITFDCPTVTGNWIKRMETVKTVTGNLEFSSAVDWFTITGTSYRQITDFMLKIRPLGGEGIIMRNPAVTNYEIGRSKNYLRFTFIQSQMEMQHRWQLEKQTPLRKKQRKPD